MSMRTWLFGEIGGAFAVSANLKEGKAVLDPFGQVDANRIKKEKRTGVEERIFFFYNTNDGPGYQKALKKAKEYQCKLQATLDCTSCCEAKPVASKPEKEA